MSVTGREYESGWKWVYHESGADPREGPRLDLISPHTSKAAATVFCRKDTTRHNWYVWDENGTGGENSGEPTIAAAMITAESAVLRWGKHMEPEEE